MADRPRVLLSEGSSLSARHTLYCLGPGCVVDIVDPAHLCQGRFSRFVRRWHECPSFSKSPLAYLEFLKDRIRRERYDVLLPTHEQVYLLARFRKQFQRHVGLALPEFDSLRRMQDKAEFIRLLEELSLPHPETRVVQTRAALLAEREFPCWVKLAHGTAGGGVWRIRTPEELKELVDRLEGTGALNGRSEFLVQQPAAGVQATAQAVFQHGRLVAAHCLEALAIGVGGSAMSRVGVSHPEVVADVRRLGAHLHWHGPLFIDYFYDAASGRPEYLECNPRMGETVNAQLSGVNFGELVVRIAMNEEMVESEPTRLGVRTHMAYMVMLARALEGAGRRELLGEWWQSLRRRGLYKQSHEELTRVREDWGSAVPSLAINLQLVAWPGSARGIVGRTVENYSLSQAAVHMIDEIDDDEAERLLGSESSGHEVSAEPHVSPASSRKPMRSSAAPR